MKAAATAPVWEINPEKVQMAIERIIEVGRPKKIILFGSYVRDALHANSDVDFLVISGDDIENPRKESVRIRPALRGISMPMDIIVVPESVWLQHRDHPAMIYREAMRNGRVVYEA
jgi:predicted nucleotidyltransferase